MWLKHSFLFSQSQVHDPGTGPLGFSELFSAAEDHNLHAVLTVWGDERETEILCFVPL